MKNEEIVKELREVIDWVMGCIANEELKTATRMALTIIEKLQPKPLFKVGPAKLRNGWDAEIYKIFDDCIHGCYTRGDGSIMVYAWTNTGSYIKPREGKFMDLLPNNKEPEEKVYGPQKCNKWAPIPWFQKGTKEVE